ncbi:unnamed protein product [Ectocarpus sp. CCAP 1310/34]|nr:unnamed protein product [Ectocarpus sp. CCAP 1310/34]
MGRHTHTVYVLLFCLSHLAADTMTVGSWECTIINWKMQHTTISWLRLGLK